MSDQYVVRIASHNGSRKGYYRKYDDKGVGGRVWLDRATIYDSKRAAQSAANIVARGLHAMFDRYTVVTLEEARKAPNYVIYSTCPETGKVIKTIYNEQTMWEGKVVEAKVNVK